MSLPAANTILVVEDESILLKFIQTILERAGYSVLTAASANEAIRIEHESKVTIDLLLMGLSPRPISGCELAVRLKRRRPELRVMWMSSDPAAAVLARANGWSLASKPFATAVLLNKIQGLLAFDDTLLHAPL